MGKINDLTGKKFGQWTVLKMDPIKNSKRIKWICICDCQKGKLHPETYSILGCNLSSGKSTRCMKCRGKKISQITKQQNKYDLSGEFGIGYSFDGKEFWFDKEDYGKIKEYLWRFDKDGYVVANSRGEHNSTIRLHRIIMNVTDSKVQIDHIKHKLFDNRKSQLRVVSNGQNGMNKDKPSNNTSGHRGVSYNKKLNKWQAYIRYNNKHMHLGYFENFEDAVKTRLDAEKRYFKEYAYDYSQSLK